MAIRNPELDKLDVLIGKWINKGYIVATKEEILTSDVYEWLPGKQFVLHTAYGRAGKQTGGGAELIGYDAKKNGFISHFFGNDGEVRVSQLSFKDGNTCVWRSDNTGCNAEFSDGGIVQTAHHVRKDEHGDWVPSMEVVLEKVM